MKTLIIAAFAVLCLSLASVGLEAQAGEECQLTDLSALNKHLEMHVTYPATGKEIKESCRKEMPDEFTDNERACLTSSLGDDQKFQNADAVRTALGLGKH